MSGTSDFQTLLASLKPAQQQASSIANTQQQRKPALQNVASPNVGAVPSQASQEPPTVNTQSKNERSQSLLNLLKFSSTTAPSQPTLSGMGNEQSAESAVAAGSSAQAAPELTSIHKSKNETSSISDQKSQDALLKLLQRSVSTSSQPKSVEVKVPDQTPFSFGASSAIKTGPLHKLPVASPHPAEEIERKGSPIRMFGTTASREHTPFDPPPVTASKEIKAPFAFSNPFDMLQASRSAVPQPPVPRSCSPQIFTSIETSANPEKTKPHELSEGQSLPRRKLMPKIPGRNGRHPTPELKKESEPVSQPSISVAAPSAEKADGLNIKEEDEAAAAGLAVIAEKLKKVNIDSGADAATPKATEQDKEPESSKSPEADVSSPIEAGKGKGDAPVAAMGVIQAVLEDEVQDRIRRVPVYNFPLKPFVAITVDNLPPSEIGLGEVIEVSRFKKDFDQADRSLVSASSSYIAYGFVKHGGVRLIRQDDGVGIQVFKESGDRVFNVVVCTTSSVAPLSRYQSVVAAGLSGAIYYATISKNLSDLFTKEDIKTESLIFPPTPLGDANTSDGMVKSRVRRSSRHPEFFGLGRGSTIRIIWPATALSAKYGVSGDDRVVDTEKFYRDRDLKITCQRAQKDFVFSEDDTVIASLDKNGKLSFWDIQALTDEVNATASKVQVQNITNPILTMATALPRSKSAPTSVLFVDKLRAYTKGVAQRYLIIGYKQNHTLQLWDLVLKRMVQAIDLPQETEQDGLCSVAYHPETGIIAVGHPTRNSIFFIHLSTPKYDTVGYSQAVFLEQLAKERKTPDLKATACLSGMREISFAQKGHLRSIETVAVAKVEGQKNFTGVATKFELYVAHSRGVTCLAIKNEDLGWNEDGKEVQPVTDGLETGVFKLSDLPNPESSDSEQQGPGQIQGTPNTKSNKKKGLKNQPEAKADVNSKAQDEPLSETNPENSNGVTNVSATDVSTPSGKKKKKDKGSISASKAPDLTKSSLRSSSPTKPSTTPNHGFIFPEFKPKDPSTNTPDMAQLQGDRQNPIMSNGFLAALAGKGRGEPSSWTSIAPEVKDDSKVIGNLMNDLETRVLKGMEEHLVQLQRRLEDDRRVTEATGNNRQEAVLRLVSSTLSDNVENTLHRIVKQQFEQQVVPTVTNTTSQAIRTELNEVVSKSLQTLVPQQIDAHIVAGITQALQNSGFARTLTDGVLKALQPTLSNEFQIILDGTVVPKFKDMAVEAALKVVLDMEARIAAQFRRMDLERAHDNAKIENIQASLQQLTDMMTRLSHSQVVFQEKLLTDHRTPEDFHRSTSDAFHRPTSAATAVRATPQPSRHVSAVLPSPITAAPYPPSRQASTVLPSPIGPPSTKTAEQLEIEEVRGLLEQQKYEAAAIKWLQSPRAVELFDEAFLSFTPDFLQSAVSPLVAFSVGVTVANSFDRNVVERLQYIYAALQTLDVRVSDTVQPSCWKYPLTYALQDPEIQSLANHAPQLLSSLLQKLEDLYSTEIEKTGGKIPHNSWLPLLHAVIDKAIQVKANFAGR